MQKKALVMEINDQNVILLTRDGQFISRQISGLCPQIGDEISIEEEKRKGVLFSVGIFLAAAALMAVFFAGKLWNQFIMPSLTTGIATYVTVDINPSVELGLNKEKMVVSVMPLNRDGRLLLEGMNLKGMNLKGMDLKGRTSEDAVNMIVNAAADQGYLAPEKENQVIINISEKTPNESQDSEISKAIPEQAAQTLAERNLNVKIDVIKTDFDLREKATELGISAGKYAILVEAKEAGLQVDADSIRKSGVTKAIEKAGGDPEKIIKSAQEEKDFAEKIEKWQQQLKEKKPSIKKDDKNNDDKNNKNVLQEIEKLWKEKEKNSSTKDRISQINDRKNFNMVKKTGKAKENPIWGKNNGYEKPKRDEDQDKVKDKNKNEEKNKNRDRDKNKDKNKEEDKDKDKDKDKNKDKDKKEDRGRDKSTDKDIFKKKYINYQDRDKENGGKENRNKENRNKERRNRYEDNDRRNDLKFKI